MAQARKFRAAVASERKMRLVVAAAALAAALAGPGATFAADPQVLAAGDIASCGNTNDNVTGQVIGWVNPAAVLTLGDNVYESGTPWEFQNCYGGSLWFWQLFRTHPSPGNHEYGTAGAAGYFGFFGAAAGPPGLGYYGFDVGAWHLVSLNSEVPHDATSPQAAWLKQDLAAHRNFCTLAYWHRPLFSSGPHGNQTDMRPLWQILYDANADVVLSGHDHDYERFAPQTAAGALDRVRGLREFVVGTGGRSLYSFATVRPNSELRQSQYFGDLVLTLHPGWYQWKFQMGSDPWWADWGSADCH